MSSRTQSERSEATRGALIDAARPLFAERGYADVGTEEIVRAAGVSRGHIRSSAARTSSTPFTPCRTSLAVTGSPRHDDASAA